MLYLFGVNIHQKAGVCGKSLDFWILDLYQLSRIKVNCLYPVCLPSHLPLVTFQHHKLAQFIEPTSSRPVEFDG